MLWLTTSICFPAVNLPCVLYARSHIRPVHRCRSATWCVYGRCWRSIAVSEIYGADVLFSASVLHSGVPSVTHRTAFMGQQVAELQHVMPAILIMWDYKSALEEMSVNKRCGGLQSLRLRSCIIWKTGVQQGREGILMQGGMGTQPFWLFGRANKSKLPICHLCSVLKQGISSLTVHLISWSAVFCEVMETSVTLSLSAG